jgi:hypothetical protein
MKVKVKNVSLGSTNKFLQANPIQLEYNMGNHVAFLNMSFEEAKDLYFSLAKVITEGEAKR